MTMPRNRANRKTVGRPKGVTAAPASSVGLCRRQLKAGYKLLKTAKQASQHTPSPAEGLCVKNLETKSVDIAAGGVGFRLGLL